MNFEQLGRNINSFFTSSKIMNNFPDMVIFIDSDGVVKDANEKAIDFFGAMKNITISELFNDGMKAVRNAVKLKKAIMVEAKAFPKKYFELTASKIDRDYCISLRDNTKIIKDEDQKNGIERFNNEKNAMLVKLQNDIKSPLNSITGFSQGLVDGIGGEITEKQDKYLKIIMNNANDLSEFTDKFLEFSYAESLLYEPDKKKFDIVSEIKDIIRNFSGVINSEKVQIEFDYEVLESRNVYMDLKALKKALTNIIEVALGLTENGKIYVRLAYPDEETHLTYDLDEDYKYLQITVKDTGAGISAEEMLHICNPYSKMEKGRKIFIRSLRLGIASILIKRAEGFMSMSSDIGQGSLYNIIIPVARAEDE